MSCENCNLIHQTYSRGIVRKRIFIEGPQGSGKSTLALLLGGHLGMEVRRGFPSGEFLKLTKSKFEVCQATDLLVLASESDTVFDRSIVSQHVWQARNGEDFDQQLTCALRGINRLGLEKTAYLFLDSDQYSCQRRQDPNGLCAIDPSQIISEIGMYQRFINTLKETLGSHLMVIQNTTSIRQKELLGLAVHALRRSGYML